MVRVMGDGRCVSCVAFTVRLASGGDCGDSASDSTAGPAHSLVSLTIREGGRHGGRIECTTVYYTQVWYTASCMTG